MQSKKSKLIISGLMVVLVIVGVIVFLFWGKDEEVNFVEEYTPQQEISEEQQRQTIVSIYYNHKETGTLMPEAKLIDVKELAKNPYMILLNLAINKPKSDKLESAIPEGTQVINVEVKSDVALVNLSSEFIENHPGGAENEAKSVYAIVNTLTELNEINSVKILIEGEENKGFSDNIINFNEKFVRLEN